MEEDIEVNQYIIRNDPEGYREIFVLVKDSPNDLLPGGDYTQIPYSLTVSPQGGKLAKKIISSIREERFYRSKIKPSDRINVSEI